MALTGARRKRAQVSYREVDTEDELFSDDQIDRPVLQLRRSARSTPARKKLRTSDRFDVQESENLEESDVALSEEYGSAIEQEGYSVRRSARGQQAAPKPEASRNNLRPGRRQNNVSYKEPSSDVDPEDFAADYIVNVKTAKPKRAPTATRSTRNNSRQMRKAQKPSTPRKSKSRGLFMRRERQTYASPTKLEETIEKPIPSDGIRPDFGTLPYHVLLQIMVYASHPLDAPAAKWLLDAACICRSFREPALTAMYRCPPLMYLGPSNQLKLVSSLIEPSEHRCFKYGAKVKRLEIDVTRLKTWKPVDRAPFTIGDLVKSTRQLTDIDLHIEATDIPPYRRQMGPGSRPQWRYSNEFFAQLEEAGISLKSWRWNKEIFSKDQQTFPWMKQVHQSKPFRLLTNLTVSNFSQSRQTGKKPANSPEPVDEVEEMAQSLAVLPNLRSLALETSDLVTLDLLRRLPPSLNSLKIANCISLTSDDLDAYLQLNGSGLRSLALDHNQALNLGFLSGLTANCPRLENLCMDLNYFSTFSTARDSDPKWDTLLSPTDLPAWPPTLRSLEFMYLRNWSSQAAKTFFRSLINSAKELPSLRYLVIHAILDISWRDRISFREHWVTRLQKAFLRQPSPPTPHFASKRAHREWKEQGSHPSIQSATRGEDEEMTEPDLEDSNEIALSQRSLRPRGKASSGEDSEVISDVDENIIDSDSNEEPFVQGLCNIMDIRIDNVRPREEILKESDFLDSEISGDEDWNEDDDDVAYGQEDAR